MHLKIKFFFLLLLSLLWGCEEKPQQKQTITDSLEQEGFKKSIPVLKEKVELLPEAKKQAASWASYITAQNEIDRLNGASIGKILDYAQPTAEIMQNLQSSLPDSLNSIPVQARLSVLVTKAEVLEQLSQMPHPSLSKIEETATEIPVEFNNFKLQLNEIFLKTIEDFENELDKMQEANRDSIKNLDQSDSLQTK